MPYFDLASYEKIVAKQTETPFGLSTDLLEYKTDRTLTLGKKVNGSTLHVFIKDGVLHSHEYIEYHTGEYMTVSLISGTIHPAHLIPSLHAIPLATDVEFAELMLEHSYPLEFVGWNSSFNRVEERVSGYFGEHTQRD